MAQNDWIYYNVGTISKDIIHWKCIEKSEVADKHSMAQHQHYCLWSAPHSTDVITFLWQHIIVIMFQKVTIISSHCSLLQCGHIYWAPGSPPSSWVPLLKLSYSKYPKSIFPDLNVLKSSILWNILWVLTSPDCFCSDLAVLTHSCALEHCEAREMAV